MNLAVKGDIRSDYVQCQGLGGICGYNSGGTIYGCSFEGTVYHAGGNGPVGGVCGISADGNIRSCYAIADVTSAQNYAGGICGKFSSLLSQNMLYSCYFVGTVRGWDDIDSYAGAVVGNHYGSDLNRLQNCFYDKERCNTTDNGFGKGLTTKELCEEDIEIGWNVGSYAAADNGKFRTIEYAYPSLVEGCEANSGVIEQYNFGINGADDWREYTLITTAEQFKAIGEDSINWRKSYILGNNIDLGGAEITPIGNYDTKFTGRFNGDGYTVSNFKINKPYDNYVGLFGCNEGVIMNVGVENAKVTGNDYVGGICGSNFDGTIIGCYNTSAVSGSLCGGVCGDNFLGTITNCYNTGTVSGGDLIGGVCGTNSSGTITNCYNTGALVGDAVFIIFIGGVCGINQGTITNCYNAGTISGADEDFGGVCGRNDNTVITNCFYNKDVCTVGGIGGADKDGSAVGLTTIEMTSADALATMNLDSAIWVKKPNADGIAYYPSFSETAAPSVTYTTELEFAKIGVETPIYGGDIEFSANALIKYENGASYPLTGGSFSIKIGGTVVVKSSEFTDGKATYTAKTAGKTTFTLVYTNAEYFTGELTKDLVIDIAKKELTAANFDFTPAPDLAFNNRQKTANVTAKLGIEGVGDVTVKYYSGGEQLKSAPINAGDYTVKISVTEGTFYKAAELEEPAWAFTIAKADAVTAPKIGLSYNWQTDEDVTLFVTGLPENMGEINSYTIAPPEFNGKIFEYSDRKLFIHIGPYDESKIGSTDSILTKLYTQNYENINVIVEITINNKANKNAPSLDDFDIVLTENGNSFTAAIVTALEGVEYSFDGIYWSSVNTLTAGHGELVTGYIRYAQTADMNASAPVFKQVNSGHGTMLVHHDRVEPTCLKAGNIEYWNCDLCGKFFADENALNELTSAETVLAASEKYHSLTHHGRVEPTCLSAGNVEYWNCGLCGKFFADENALNELTSEEIVLAVSGKHSLVHYARVEPTCTVTGTVEHWRCALCGKFFADTNALNELTSEEIVIAASGKHLSFMHHERVEPTCLNAGSIEYWSCDFCGKLFSDENALNEITSADIAIAASGRHGAAEIRNKVDPTRDSAGYTGDTVCVICGEIIARGTVIPPYGGYNPSAPATTTSAAAATTEPDEIEPQDDEEEPDDDTLSEPENEPFIQSDSSKIGWDAILDVISGADEGDTIAIDMNGTTELPKDILNEIKGKDITLVLDMDGGFEWEINGKDVTDPRDIDIGISEGANIPVKVINALTGEFGYISITLEHDGEFGFKAVLRVDLGKQNKGLFANLYYYLGADKTALMNSAKIGSSGTAKLEFTHTSEYVIVIDDHDHTAKTADDANDEVIAVPTDDEDENPPTGATLSLAAVLIAGAAAAVSRKKRK